MCLKDMFFWARRSFGWGLIFPIAFPCILLGVGLGAALEWCWEEVSKSSRRKIWTVLMMPLTIVFGITTFILIAVGGIWGGVFALIFWAGDPKEGTL